MSVAEDKQRLERALGLIAEAASGNDMNRIKDILFILVGGEPEPAEETKTKKK